MSCPNEMLIFTEISFFVNVCRHHLPFTQLLGDLGIVNVGIELDYFLPLNV